MDKSSTIPFLGRIRRPHFCDEAIHIGDFSQAFGGEVQQRVNGGLYKQKEATVLAVAMEMKPAAVEEVAQICSIDQLTCDNEPPALTRGKRIHALGYTTSLPNFDVEFAGSEEHPIDEAAASRLASLRHQRRRLEVEARSKEAHKRQKQRLRYSREIRLETGYTQAASSPYPMRSFSLSPSVVMVRVYQPSADVLHGLTSASYLFRLSREFACLGGNRLTQLRDKITCPNDTAVVNDCSQAHGKIAKIFAKDVYPSGFFCINRTFYVDRRDPEALDYSEPIRQWAEKRGMEPLAHRSMEETTLDELTVRLGYPYVYVHQGKCQHIVVFSDVRLFHPTMPSNLSSYPVVMGVSRYQSRICQICERCYANWLTKDHELTPTEFTYFCEACFKGFNYKTNGHRIASFKAFPYNPIGEIDAA